MACTCGVCPGSLFAESLEVCMSCAGGGQAFALFVWGACQCGFVRGPCVGAQKLPGNVRVCYVVRDSQRLTFHDGRQTQNGFAWASKVIALYVLSALSNIAGCCTWADAPNAGEALHGAWAPVAAWKAGCVVRGEEDKKQLASGRL